MHLFCEVVNSRNILCGFIWRILILCGESDVENAQIQFVIDFIDLYKINTKLFTARTNFIMMR